MQLLLNNKNEEVRLTDERLLHIEECHPEMIGQLEKCKETLRNPEEIRISKSDSKTELFYRFYQKTPVTSKYLCVVTKNHSNDRFIITAYFTDKIKSK